MSDTDFFLNQTGGSVSTQLGTRLSNIKNQVLSTQSIIGVQTDNSSDAIPYSAFGKSLLSVSTLNGLVGLINTADTNVQVIDSGVGEINFTLDNALKLAVKNAYTEVMNELRTLTIIPTTTTCDIGGSSISSYFRDGYFKRLNLKNGNGVDSNVLSQILLNWEPGGNNYAHSIRTRHRESVTSANAIDFYLWQVGNGITAIGDKHGMSITGGGVGIGTTTASNSILTLKGSGSETSMITFNRSNDIPYVGCGYDETNDGFCIKDNYGGIVLNRTVLFVKRDNSAGALIGIGTTNPKYNLHILNTGTSGFTNTADKKGLLITGTDASRVLLETTGNTTARRIVSIGNDDNYFKLGILNDNGTAWTKLAFLSCSLSNYDTTFGGGIYPESTNTKDIGNSGLAWNGVYCNGLIQPSASNSMTFNCNSAERMRISSTGYVGIGSNSPQTGLHLNSSNTTGTSILLTSGSNTVRAISAGVVSNEICGLKGPDADGGCLRLSAGGGSSLSLKTFIDMYGYGSDSATNTYMALGTAGSERVRISSTGLVGINNNNPNSNLTITGASSNLTLTIVAPAEAYDVATASAKNAYSPKGTLVSIANTTGTASSATLIDINAYQNTYATNVYYGAVSGTAENGPANFVIGRRTGATSWAESIRIDKGGSLLVGTTTPTAGSILTVNGNTTCIGNILVDADNTRSVATNTNALSAIYCHAGNFKSIAVHSATGGNIGTQAKGFSTLYCNQIGDSVSPVANVYGNVWQTTSTSNLRAGNNLILMGLETLPVPPWYDLSCSSTIQMDTTNLIVGGKQTFDSTNKELVFKTTVYPSETEVERLRIGASLKTSVNIIPTDANRMLGSTSFSFNTLYVDGILNPSASVPLKLGCNGLTTMYVSSTNVKIGTNIGTERLVVDGNIKFSTAGNLLPIHNVSQIGTSNTDRFLSGYFGTVYGNGVALTSDRRLKDNIKPISNGLSTVMKMRPVEYNMKGRVRLHTGFLADEMKNLYNNEDWAVFVEDTDEQKTQSLQYTEVVAVTVKAIQEINDRLDSIELQEAPSNRPQLVRQGAVLPPTGLNAIGVESEISSLRNKIHEIEDKLDGESKSDKSDLINSLIDKNNYLETKLSSHESKIDELTTKLSEYESKIKNKTSVESKNEIAESDADGSCMIESLQERLYKAEQLAVKQQKMITKLTNAVNKILAG